MNRPLLALLALLLTACPKPHHPAPSLYDAPHVAGADASEAPGTSVTLVNQSGAPVTVYFAFGADSIVNATSWAGWCVPTSPLTCSFMLAGSKLLPTGGAYLNATISYNAPVGCGSTKAEVNVNNPTWYDTLDISLVDGYSNKMQIDYTPPGGAMTTLGPVVGATGNESMMGIFPLACDICVARQSPPCGKAPGGPGCHAGTQYAPIPVCQYQGAAMGGGGTVNVLLLGT